MQYGLIRTAAIAPEMRVADPEYNALSAAKAIKTAAGEGAQLVVLPRLFLTGCTCGALFNTASLIKKAESALLTLAQQTEDCDCAVAVGLPVAYRGRLFDCAAVLCAGQLVGLTCAGDPPAPFAPGKECFVDLCGAQVPMAPDTVYRCENAHELSFNIEIGEVLPALAPITVHLDASPETAFSDEHRAGTILARTRQSGGAMICCCPGTHESTTDFVYSGAQLIAENGVMLAQSLPFEGGCAITEIDYELVCRNCKPKLETVEAEFELCDLELTLPLYRTVEKDPFMPSYADRDGLCRKVLELQARGLARRMAHTNAKAVVLGISGGLDSTMALVVCYECCRKLGLPSENIVAVSMPGFGTEARTRDNSVALAEALKVDLRIIPITEAVNQHFKDIGHDPSKTDVVYENSQARERTQILMDIANQTGGLVVGTGDLSENALGWCTYNGDHMSMYAVNASIPKTLMRHIISNYASVSPQKLAEILLDVCDTPVSPELVPGKQYTEEIIGSYDLHDFFLYNFIKYGTSPAKLLCMAAKAFEKDYTKEKIFEVMNTFFTRFFQSQFKRAAMPDAPDLTGIELSKFEMPSDASARAWKKELEYLKSSDYLK